MELVSRGFLEVARLVGMGEPYFDNLKPQPLFFLFCFKFYYFNCCSHLLLFEIHSAEVQMNKCTPNLESGEMKHMSAHT